MRDQILPDDLFSSGPEAVRTQGVGAKADRTFSGTQPPGCDPAGFRLTAVAYYRVSTDKQDLGLDAQQASVTALAARDGLKVRDSFVDIVSGGLGYHARALLLEAVGTLHKGEVLLVARRDRLGRDLPAICLIEALVHKHKARVVSAAGQGCGVDDDPENLDNIFTRRMYDVFAEHERLLIGYRTKKALGELKARDRRTGTLPFGFMLDPDDPDHKHLVPAPVEQRIAATIRETFDLVHSIKATTATLNAAGYTTRKGTPWRPAYVARQLRKVAG